MKYMPIIWLAVLTIAMAIGQAHAGVPSCFPGDPEADAQTADQVRLFATDQGQCAQWACDVGHKWVPVSICGTDTEAVLAAPALRAAMLLSHDAKAALWASTFNAPITPGGPDDQMLKAAAARPVPVTPPPSGRIVTSTVAYYLIQQPQALVALPIGVLDPRAVCGASPVVTINATRYYAVPTASVVSWYGGKSKPGITVMAICD